MMVSQVEQPQPPSLWLPDFCSYRSETLRDWGAQSPDVRCNFLRHFPHVFSDEWLTRDQIEWRTQLDSRIFHNILHAELDEGTITVVDRMDSNNRPRGSFYRITSMGLSFLGG